MGKQIIARGQATIVTQKDSYTINQSVGEYIFTAQANGTIQLAVTVVSTVKVTLGDNNITNFTIGTINKPAGFASINVNNTNKTITYTVAANTTTLADNGMIPIPVIIEGVTYTISFKWAKSKTGQDGTNGVGIKSVVNKYAVSSSNTIAPTSWSTAVPTMTATDRYLWNYEIVTYTNGSTNETGKRVIGVYGNTGATGKGVSSVDILYYLSTSSTSQTGGNWTSTAPAWANGKYMWSKTKITYTDGSFKETSPVCITGAKGSTGNTGATGKGIKSIVEQYYLSISNTAQTGGTWVSTPPAWENGKYMWTRSVITYTDNSTVTTTPACVTGAKGDKGDKGNTGATGATGKGVSSVDILYYLSTSAASLSGGAWSTNAPAWVNGKYMWSKNKITYTDGKVVETKPICITGAKGATGNTGATGATGKGVKSIVEQYYLSTSNTTQAGGSWSTTPPAWVNGKYMWTRSVITYTDNSTTTTTPVCVTGAKGDKGDAGATGATGKGVSSVDVLYYLSTSSTAQTGGSWSTTPPAWQNGKYMWSKTKITYTDKSVKETNPVCITGAKGNTGNTGATGATGKGVKSIAEQYYLSTSNTSQTGGAWANTPPAWVNGKYMWTRSTITYTDNSTTTTTPVCVTGSKGDKGDKGDKGNTGATGAAGKGVTSIDVLYYLSTSATSLAGGSWSTNAPAWVNGKYMWSKNKITYTDGKVTETEPVCITGAKGNTGNTGATGATGKGVRSIVEQYYLSTSNTSQSGGTWTTTPPSWTNGKYMWTRSVITYTDNSTTTTSPVCVSGSKGDTGTTGNGISSITEYYLASASSSGVTTSTSGWTTTIQSTSTSKKYLWNYEVVLYTNGSRYTSKPVIIGTHGNTGATGPAGKPGADGYTISASRNSYVISTDKDGRIHSTVTTNTVISVLKGSTPVTPTIGALPTVAGCTLSKSGATVTIVFNVGTSLAENGTISIPVVADGKSFTVSFAYAKARTGANGVDSNMLDWVKDWNNNKTQINENTVITPKIFAGVKNSNGTLTGTAIGRFPLSVRNSSGAVVTETINGIYGFKNGYKTFYVDNTGNAGLGKGNQLVRYNAATGKIEFGSEVSLNWINPINTAKQDAIKSAATDAQKKADAAKSAAITTASNDATSKANKAKQDAINSAAATAQQKADAAKNAAISEAAKNTDSKISALQIGGTNLLKNSDPTISQTGWTKGPNVTVDTNIKYQGRASFKSVQSGNSNRVWRGIEQGTLFNTAKQGDIFTASVYVYAENRNGIDNGAAMEIRYWNAEDGRITQSSTSIVPAANKTWQRFVLTGTCPAGTVRVSFVSYVTKNGTLWFNGMKLERGNKATDWSQSPEDFEASIADAKKAGDDARKVADNITNKANSEGWSTKLTYIDSKGIFTGTLSTNTVNAIKINASQITSGTISADRIAAGSINASKIAAGTITSAQLNADSIKANIINTSYIQGLTLSFTKGKIGGWSMDGDSIFRGTKNNTSGAYTSASGHMTIGSNGIRGFKWRLDSSGAGALAGGNISWDASGKVSFSSNVSLNWTNAANNALNSAKSYADTKKTEAINSAAATAQQKADAAKNAAISAASSDATNKANKAKQDAINSAATTAQQKADAAKSAAISAAATDAQKKADAAKNAAINAAATDATNKANNGRLYARGTNFNNKVNSLVYLNGQLIANIASRGLTLTVINRNNLSVVSTKNYDVYTNEANCNSLASALNALGSDKIVVLTSYDAIMINATLNTALQRCGGSNLTVSSGRHSYVLIGIPTIGKDNGLVSFYGSEATSPYAEVSTLIINGVPQGMNIMGQQKTYIDGNGIYTGRITASQITAGTISASRIDVNAIKSSLITAGNIEALTLNVTKGKIGGWSITGSTIAKNSVSLGSDGSIINGTKWKLNNDGSGQLANGNIKWDTSGKVSFGSSVSLNWTNAANNALNSAKSYADAKKTEAINSAATTAQQKADAAKNAAISSAASDAQKKADAAKNTAISSAATTAQQKADAAKSAAINEAAKSTDSKIKALQVGGVNLLKNTNPTISSSGWYLSAASADKNIKYQGRDSFKITQSGNEKDVWRGMEQKTVTGIAKQNDIFTASLYTYTDNINGIDNGARMEIRHFDSAGTCLLKTSANIKPSANKQWQKFSVSGTCPAKTVQLSLIVYVVRNGTYWVNGIKLERGSKATDWSPSPEDTQSRLTKIDANGIYTGTVNASQITAGTINAARIDVNALKSTLITAGNINALTLNVTKGQIGGFKIFNSKISTYDNPKNGHYIEIHNTGYICNSRTSDSKDYWALNADGSASFGLGKSTFKADGSGFIANNKISWNTDGSVKINGNFSMTGDSASKFTLEYNGTNFFRINDPGSTGFVSMRSDGRTALSISTYGNNSYTKGIHITCNASGYGYAIESYGNVLLAARNSEKVTIRGLHVNARNISGSTTLNSNDDFISFSNTGGITVYMPTNAAAGKIIYFKKRNSHANVYLKGNFRSCAGVPVYTDFTMDNECSMFFIKDTDGRWVHYWCG